MLDTNIAIYAADGHEPILQKLLENEGAIAISALSLAELERGIAKDPAHAALRRLRLDILLPHLPVLPFDASAAAAYGRIIAICGWVRARDFDRMIAAHALSTGSVLVTNNLADFRDVPGLVLENWVP